MDASQQLEETNNSLLIFDGDCGFCTSTAIWVSSNNSKINIASWQSIDLSSYGLTESEVTSAAYWINSSGESFRGHIAIGKVLKQSSQRWRRFAGSIILFKPLNPFAKFFYKLISKNRHRLPGSTENCAIK